MHTHRRRAAGFTLIELLVAIALMIFLMTLIVQIFVTSTQVFNRAKAKTEIYQNARFALDRMGKEINNIISAQLGTQDFRVGFPGSGAAPWYGTGATTFHGVTEGGVAIQVSRPLLVMVSSTSWIDGSGQRQIGTAKVAYRVLRNPVPDAIATVSCTLERSLFVPGNQATSDPWVGASNPGTYSMRIVDSAGDTLPGEDYCQFVYFDESSIAHIAFQYFDIDSSDPTKSTYRRPSGGTLMTFAALPPSLRVIVDVIDEKDREIRTLSRQFTIYAWESN